MSEPVIWGVREILDENGQVDESKLAPMQKTLWRMCNTEQSKKDFIVGFHAYECRCDLCVECQLTPEDNDE